MPRKAKEKNELESLEKSTKTKSTTTRKKATDSKTTTSKKSPSDKKSTTTKSTTTSKKTTSTRKKSSSTVTKKSTSKTTTSKKRTSSSKKKVEIVPTEYYDLPYKYNQTVVKILAQTPKRLFIYWEISDEDINKYKEQYGENFFETTKPVLIVYNDTLNYSFEVEINDFANSWYLQINDSKSNYRVDLGRRPFEDNKNIKTNYIYITSSNKLETPNDHILFNNDNAQNMIYFRNVKTEQVFEKPITNFYFMKSMNKIYNIYDLYKELYKNQDNLEDLSNPSS